MSDVIHTETLERDGYTFRVEHFHDGDASPPWVNGISGPVTDWTTRDKSPGELVLNSNRSENRFYDFAEACRIALRDGWGAREAEDGMTRRQIAALAAREDYELLRAWCNNEWCYIGVVVTLLDVEGNETDATDSLWNVDDNGDYAATVASDCVDNIISAITDALHFERPDPITERSIYSSGARTWIVREANA